MRDAGVKCLLNPLQGKGVWLYLAGIYTVGPVAAGVYTGLTRAFTEWEKCMPGSMLAPFRDPRDWGTICRV